MDGVTVIIPTRGRWEKLMNTLDSIPSFPWLHICVVCDGDPITYENLIAKCGFSHCMLTEDAEQNMEMGRIVRLLPVQRGSVFCRNYVLETIDFEYVLCATDDIVFDPLSIENAHSHMLSLFPNGDGVVGFKQKPHSFHETGVILVGRQWLKRYPDRHMYNPEYFHFACQEILWLTEKIGGKFFQSPDSYVVHLHPSFNKKLMDVTHIDARRYKDKDHILIGKRQKCGQIWGNAEVEL